MSEKNRDEYEEIDQLHQPLVQLKNGIIYFFDEMNGASVLEAIKFIDSLESIGVTEIVFKINSGGGSIYDGMALYDRLRACKAKVIMHGSGLVGSMGFMVYLAGDKRYCSENVTFLNHQAKIGFGGGPDLTPEQIKIEQIEMKQIEKICTDIIADRTLLTPKIIKNHIKLGDKYINAKEAISMGIAHEIHPEINKEILK